MKVLTLTSLVLAALGVTAAPGPSSRRTKASTHLSNRRSQPAKRLDPAPADTTTTNVVYVSNWAGAVIETTGVQSVTGTFVAPVPSTDGSGTAWVGIDGNDCYTGILQTGINWYKTGSNVSYVAWYEWYPASMQYWSDFAIGQGDTIRVTVTASSTRTGTALLENLSRQTSISHEFTADETLSPICQTDAEWIVEDYYENFDFVTFADFGTVTFTDASAVTTNGTIGLETAQVYDIKQDEVIRTNSSIVSNSSVAVSWIK